MRALLIPARNAAYGQDFLDRAIAERFELTPVLSMASNKLTLAGACQVISQNPDMLKTCYSSKASLAEFQW